MSSIDHTDSIPTAPTITTTYLRDYTPPPYHLTRVELHFDLEPEHTLVTAQLHCVAREPLVQQPLVLDGHALELLWVKLDGRVLSPSEYVVNSTSLTLPEVPAECVVTTAVKINPQANTALEGLYCSNQVFCTQCEAEGFRRITYFPDRPDVMTVFRTTIEADKTQYPVLLSNGNCIQQQDLPNNRQRVIWDDPFKKPCYLFALVAGQLSALEDQFVTQSGRTVQLKIYTGAANLDRCDHAMQSLKQAMRWDEEAYGREYDLDLFMIAAIDDFNMGAMENKGLNVFNSSCVLAKAETATDDNFASVLSIVGHEYFHNWTGNRITCRDWFQLSLKEGLTVFRDQEFYATVMSRAGKRIADVNKLRSYQFPEDAGPLAHPVRPEAYIEINNFYTMTIYEKGAEVIRMYQTLLGVEGFRKGMDCYFARHDGQAVTTDDFLQAMADANRVDLSQFKLWYSQAGTPVVSVSSHYDAPAKTYELTLQQHCPLTPDQKPKLPLHIPVAVGLIDAQGQDIPLQLAGETTAGETTRVLELKQASQSFVFVGIEAEPIPSVLRGFSAPVKLDYRRDRKTLAFLSGHDSDGFNRWEAMQRLLLEVLLEWVDLCQQGAQTAPPLDVDLLAAFTQTLQDSCLDAATISEALTMPSETYIGDQLAEVDVDAIHQARYWLLTALAQALQPTFLALYQANATPQPYQFTPAAMGQRRLKNLCLTYLMSLQQPASIALCQTQLQQANNMTDEFAALAALNYWAPVDHPARITALQDFYHKWQHDRLVVNKWLALQASASQPGTLALVKALQQQPVFALTNPDNVRALLGTFAKANPLCFHAADGAGYEFMAQQIVQLDRLNPIIASRLASCFSGWRRYDTARQSLMQAQLSRIHQQPEISRDLFEVVDKSLG